VEPSLYTRLPWLGLAWRYVLVGVAYYLGSVLGYALLFPSSFFAVMWPPNTVLLVALLLSAPWQWLWLLLFVVPVHLLVQAQHGVAPLQSGLYYASDCVLVLTTAAALRRAGLDDLVLRDLRRTLLFLAVTTIATGLGSLAWSPLIVSLSMDGDLWASWHRALLSNLLPFLITTPGIVVAVTRGAKVVRTASAKQYAEVGALGLGLIGCGLVVFGPESRPAGSLPTLLYAPLPFLLWAAVRFGPGGLSLAFFGFALMATFGAATGQGPFVPQSLGANVLWLQISLLALYVPLLVLAALVEERRGKEEALRESESRYRAVVEDQTELICRFLPDGTYTFVNDAYCRYFKTSPEQLLGRTFWTFIPPEGHQAAREFLASITPDHPVATREHEVVAPGGELRWQQWRDRGFFDARGRVVEYQAVGRDITERKHVEEAMQGLSHVGRLAVVGELTGSIAHELSQPLSAILMNAAAADKQLQSASPSLEELRAILADIQSDDLRATEVIRRMRALLRKRELVLSPLRVNELAAEVVLMVAADARRRRITMETALSSTLADTRGDRVHLQQVLLNLILNGMEAMEGTPEERRRLIVRTGPDGSRSVKVSVIDAGDGIPADRLPRVFESFFTTKEGGMGLGLAIARSIVDLHGGHIWAENNPGGGAAFHFTLPVAAEAVSA
jgi:PAS domain S-box-containing protein